VIVQWVPAMEGADVADIEAVPDVLPQLGPDPTQTFFYAAFQWDMRAIRAQDAWPTGFQGQGAKVAILDTGIDDTHPELAGKVDHALSVAFTPNQNPAPFPVWGDDNLHGTHVASTVAGNLFAMASVAPQATLIAVKVLNRNGSGSFGNIIAGILHATNAGANVINMSLGAYFPKNARGGGPLNAALAKAVNYAEGHGVFVVCAAGNNGVNLDHDVNFVFVPAQSGTAFAVSATGPIGQASFDHLAHYSNYGRTGPAVAAPGGEFGQPGSSFRDLVLGACSRQTLDPRFAVCRNGSFYIFAAGTSMASPHAAGVAALVLSRFGLSQNPGQVRTRIEQTADDLGAPGVDLFYSHGRINAGRAVNQ
jgi:lantibiotic leader peptide-processing serine protease